MKRIVQMSLGWLLVLIAVGISGCRGLSTQDERAARHDLATVSDQYRPDGQSPALPELNPDGGLSNYLAFAVLNQPKVEAAYFDWAASVQRITMERSLANPRLTYESDIADTLMTIMPGFMQEFPGPGKLRAASLVASTGSQAKYFKFETAVLQTAFDLKRSYYTLHFLDEKIRINCETLQLLGDLESIARAQNEVGKVTMQDVYRAQIEKDQLETTIANLEDSRTPLLAQFKGALGLRPDQADPPLPTAFESTSLEVNADQILSTAYARNPRLKAMEAEVRMADAEIAMAAKSKWPDFYLGLKADVKANPVMFRPEAGMTLPIWRDKIAAQISAAQASQRAAAARLNAEQIMVAVDLAMKTYDYREVTRNLALLHDQLIPKARQSLEIARAGYLAGQIEFFNLVDAQRTLLNFELADVEARTRREIILADLSLLIAGVPPQGTQLLDPSQTEAVATEPSTHH